MLSYSVLDANVVDVEKRRNPSKHYVSSGGARRSPRAGGARVRRERSGACGAGTWRGRYPSRVVFPLGGELQNLGWGAFRSSPARLVPARRWGALWGQPAGAERALLVFCREVAHGLFPRDGEEARAVLEADSAFGFPFMSVAFLFSHLAANGAVQTGC